VEPASHDTVVRLYASLREAVGERDVEVALADGATIRELINRLVELRPVLADRLLDEDGNIPPSVNVFVNGRDIRDLNRLDTPVMPEDEVTILPPAAGGRA
jgi:molybdopterin synthase sulfur carrier subunit